LHLKDRTRLGAGFVGTNMKKSSTDSTTFNRRGLLKAGMAASVLAIAPGVARAQPKIAPPNIIKAGTLVMSINPTLPPLQFVDDKGQLQGMRVELANECCKRLGLAPEYIRTEFATMIPGLAAKRWDMINTGIYWTEERSKLMYMVPYEQAALSFLVAKGNPLGLKTVDDLAGKRISVELGGIEERRTREVNDIVTKKGLKPVTVMTFNNFAEAFQALKAGQSDAATSIDATAMYMQQRGDFTRAISGVFPQTACFAFANKPLAEAVVGALNELKKDGFYDKLFDQYGVLKMDEPTFSIKGPGPG
jgi:polar amino acid transport system substrate-binding protein